MKRNPDYLAKRAELEIARNAERDALLEWRIPGVNLGAGSLSPNGWGGYPGFSTDPLGGSMTMGFPATNGGRVTTNVSLGAQLGVEQKLPYSDTRFIFSLWDRVNWALSSNVVSAGVQVSQPLLRRSESTFQWMGARQAREKLERDLQRTRLDLEYKLEAAWWDWAVASHAVRVQDNKRAKSRTNLAETERKYTSGLIKEVEALRIRFNDQSIQSTALTFVRQERERRNALFELVRMDRDDRQAFAWEDPGATAMRSNLAISLVRFDEKRSAAESLACEPSLLNHAYERWKEDQAWSKALENMRPVGDLSASLTHDLNATATWQVGLAVNLLTPLWDRGDGARAGVTHRLRLETIERQRDADERGLRRDLGLRLRELEEIREQVSIARVARDLAERIYKIDVARFDLGLITSTQLIESEDDYFTAELTMAQQAARWIKAVRFLETRYRMARAAP
ncbi:MAG: TolC family protein [Spirochaetes bacterium]|nr:TolC family protein [Spirochaetota bacterium]